MHGRLVIDFLSFSYILGLYGHVIGLNMSSLQVKQRAKVKEKIDKCVKEKLFDFCELLDIPVSKSIKKVGHCQ